MSSFLFEMKKIHIMPKNKVILMGGSHHNGLGLARTFGVNRLFPYGIVIGEGAEKSFVRKSKYWAKTWSVENEKQAIELMLHEFGAESQKPVVIPWSDAAAEAIDANLDKLKNKFIVPSLAGRQGAVVELMDKDNQVTFAAKYGLPMAKSCIVPLEQEIAIPADFPFPCIVKPVASYEGQKYDIRKCDNRNETIQYLRQLKAKGYHRILVQEFIDFEYELEFVGCCCEKPAYLISKTLRGWPVVGGTNSFFQCMNDTETNKVCKHILQALRVEGYNGMFDIELFNVNGKVYLNEINWRNTGNSFFNLGTQVYYPVIWYLSNIGEDTSHLSHFCKDTAQCAMNEATDLRHVVYENLPLRQWNKDRNRTQSFALWYAPDLWPAFAQYGHLMAEMLRRGKKGK